MDVWNFFVWMFWLYVAVTCIWIFIMIVMDVFRDADLSGIAKALWVVFLVVVPFLAAIIYLIARGRRMSQREAERAQVQQAQSDAYIREAAGAPSAGGQIESAKRLLDSGAITQAEFDTLKAHALAPA